MVDDKCVEKVKTRVRKQKYQPNIEDDEQVALELQNESDTQCEVCESNEHPEVMLLCDCCDRGYHLSCLNPPKTRVPRGDWYCDICQEFYIGHQPQILEGTRRRVILDQNDDNDVNEYIADDFLVEDDVLEYNSEDSYQEGSEKENIEMEESFLDDSFVADLSDSDIFVSPSSSSTRTTTATSALPQRKLKRKKIEK